MRTINHSQNETKDLREQILSSTMERESVLFSHNQAAFLADDVAEENDEQASKVERKGINGSSVNTADAEVQLEASEIDVLAGITGYRTMLDFPYLHSTVSASLSVITGTSGHRGVHMSRLVLAVQDASKCCDTVEEFATSILKQVNSEQPGTQVKCEFDLPFHDQIAKISIAVSDANPLSYCFLVNGITSCPCSKRISGVGHMQRATLKLLIESEVPISKNFAGILTELSRCFSYEPVAMLKRKDEAEAVLAAQENSKFVEDVVRDCLRRFPEAKEIEVTSAESIHMHDAVARWKRKRENNDEAPLREVPAGVP